MIREKLNNFFLEPKKKHTNILKSQCSLVERKVPALCKHKIPQENVSSEYIKFFSRIGHGLEAKNQEKRKKEKKKKKEKKSKREIPGKKTPIQQQCTGDNTKMGGGGWMKRKAENYFHPFIHPSIHLCGTGDVSQVSPGKGETKKEEYLLFTFTYLPRADSKVTAAKRKDGAMRVQREREREAFLFTGDMSPK